MTEATWSRSWATTPAARLVGAAASWFVFALCFTLLYRSAVVLIGIGGSCASGGPYAIEVECPDAVALFAPLSFIGGFIAVGISLALARGFGTPMVTLAWPVLFCGLGLVFFAGFAAEPQAWSWLMCGILFQVMGLAPLVWGLRANAREVAIGSVSLEGVPFTQPDKARTWLPPRRPSDLGPSEPTPRDWMLAIGVTVIAGGLGVWLGAALFDAVAAA